MEGARPDWYSWHEPYDRPGSALADRLEIVKGFLREALDEAPAGEIRLVSLCAGQGRDVVEVVAAHPRAGDVRARLVELDERNVAAGRQRVEAAGLDCSRVELRQGDASTSDAWRGAVPARIVLACGIFGNVTPDDIKRTVQSLPMLCAEGATVVWTRHRRPPDLTPRVRAWFEEAGFLENRWVAPAEHPYVGVGAARWGGPDGHLAAGHRFFTFRGDGS